jgi:hypothetical protein
MKPTSLSGQFSNFMYKHHFVLFVIAVIGSMSVVVFLINQSLQNSTDTSSITESTSVQFDQKTIDQVNNLQSTSDQKPLDLPSDKRVNPFIE